MEVLTVKNQQHINKLKIIILNIMMKSEEDY